jgi:hypothetical protein
MLAPSTQPPPRSSVLREAKVRDDKRGLGGVHGSSKKAGSFLEVGGVTAPMALPVIRGDMPPTVFPRVSFYY